MAMHVPKAPGFAQMLKDGAKHYSGLEEAVFRNIQACKELAQTTRTAYGPNGMNKMVINHLEKLFVTNDAATILRELEVQHPAAKMVVMASHMQEQEVGDGTNFVLVFAGALLELAEELLRMGLSVSEVIEGYELAMKKSLELLPECVCASAKNLHDVEEATAMIRPAVMSKQYGNEDFLANLIAQACVSIFPESGNFSVDNVRVCKILGCGLTSSSVLHGMVFKKETEGDVTSIKDSKIAVFSCPFDCMVTETKGTVLINNAEELLNFSKGEEDMMEAQVKSIAEAGANVVVTGGKVADMALHYANKYQLMVVRLNSKWDLRRLCKTVGAVALPRLTPPTPEEMGHCDSVYLDEVGDTQVVVFKHEKEDGAISLSFSFHLSSSSEKEDGAISTLVIRGSTDNRMDDIERAIDDGVNTFKVLVRDKRLVPGAGATEIELARQITSYGESCPGLEQYAIKKFAEAFEAVPRALAENSGIKGNELISKLYAVHHEGNKNMGFDIEGEGAALKDMLEAGILEPFLVKHWGIKLATNAAITVLRVDQIIMAKPAGGPKAPTGKKDWDEDD
ncbi:T-complex protein 1 subunit theta isoform X2 [Oncorhynchus keta]|uniref:T-complex protein 1 subunit theta isoform X2 n=1 Tax=Oncorhynchus keta TaxID=8018 RepID=UPI00227BED1D|nr:T-complex protein 1 subunit theta isoform X2 [Oncorhynchus keta]